MDRPITRRDFLNGVAIGVGATLAADAARLVPGIEALQAAAVRAGRARLLSAGADRHARQPRRVVRRVARAARRALLATAGTPIDTGETYDLVVVGGGISGLAAAYFYRARTSRRRRAS